ncbi:TIR domain-containing protein [Fulvivirgaceae bacterium PWU4]|uniref:TIR domain-containing protein n=1 Tax=Chryseosolibacter histidini TaxID=2782349 RepID=A0AAP2DH70_9BACT|nr:toll/interleukin-1 receptor domain-containing protein [Chryseosolibacter histidini]MBT1696176.1 TIR domain-containing protein [Chryseosolibacter histidini]
MWPSRYKYDVFISHAVEDRPISAELCARLENAGFNIWYSGKELKPGDSLEATIQKNMARSRYGVAILTPTYLQKHWTMKEFNTLQSRESIKKVKVILPVLHETSIESLKQKDIIIADKWAIYYEKGIDHVVQALREEIEIRSFTEWVRKNAYALRFWGILLVSLVALYFVLRLIPAPPSTRLIETSILQRQKNLEDKILHDHALMLQSLNAQAVSLNDIRDDHVRFTNFRSYFRNEYEFNNGFATIRFKKNVGPALNLDLESAGPYNAYTLAKPSIFLANRSSNNKTENTTYLFVNTLPATYRISGTDLLDDGAFVVHVSWAENLRHVTVNLSYPVERSAPKKTKVTFAGFAPEEKYTFLKIGNTWELKSVE